MALINRVAGVMKEFAPLALADRSWDNVGVLVEAPTPNESGVVMLTIDLTPEVLAECQRHHAEVIVAYHPPIFASLKHLQLASPKERMLLEVIRDGISIFAPHTSLDAVEGGINDWLARLIDVDAASSPIIPTTAPNADPTRCGMGRVLQLSANITMDSLVANLKKGLRLQHLRVAMPPAWSRTQPIHSVALCAGSGGGVFKQLRQSVDVLVSGEMGHHEVLAAVAGGSAVVLCEHTNSERGYLTDVLAPMLKERLASATILVSEVDRDPLTVWAAHRWLLWIHQRPHRQPTPERVFFAEYSPTSPNTA